MLISFREAADLSFQISLAVAVVIGGMSLAAVTAKGDQTPHQMIDVSRPVLWEADVVRVDRQAQLLTITIRPAKTKAGQAANTVCSDAIGLRIACDLVASDHQPS